MRRIGVLGGGQLARLLLTEGHRHGIEVHAYCQSESDPAFRLHKENKWGPIEDTANLQAFYDAHDVITFESEFIDPLLIRGLRGGAEKTFPRLETMDLLRDRKSQKWAFEKFGVPASPTIQVTEHEEIINLLKYFPKGLVAKKRTHGYDGYGTFMIRTLADAQSLTDAHKGKLNDLIIEPLVTFKRELAVMVYRSATGQCGALPWVEWKAKDSKCWWVKGPIANTKLHALSQTFTNFLRKLDYVGVMAFECFELKNKVIVNEVAPRVHNSMHHSLDSLTPNQFELHLACLLGAEVPKSVSSKTKGFAMVNLLGSSDAPTPNLNRHKDGQLYWYGKNQNRNGRKMGHINALAENPDKALKVALKGARQCQL